MYHKNSETLRCSQHFFGGRQKCKILLTEDAAGAIKAHVGADYQQLGRGFTTWDDLLLQFTVTTNFNVDTAVEPEVAIIRLNHTLLPLTACYGIQFPKTVPQSAQSHYACVTQRLTNLRQTEK